MIKIYRSIILAILIVLSVVSCNEESNMDPEGQWTLSNPSITSPTGNTSVVVLNETKPDSLLKFEWTAAISSANYGITYSVVFDTLNSTNFESPILEVKSGNGGKNLSLGIKASELNEALSLAGYPANAVAQLSWAIKAYCLSKTSYSSQSISVKRFATEIKPSQLYISGEATENGPDLSQAILLKRLNGSDGTPSNKFEVYTSLTNGKNYKFYSAKSLPAHQYGGSTGTLVKSGAAINADETGVFRISVDMDNATYSLKKIDKFSVVGANINGGWGGDEALVYQGGGVWKRSVDLIAKGSFVFRANGDWGLLLKRIKGTTANVVMESDAAGQGAQYEDIPSDAIGKKIVTLDLSANAYTYKIERDPGASGPITPPASLFLLQGTTKVCEFTKNGDVFTSIVYLPLQGSVTYTLNSAADGSGTSYAISANIGVTTTPGSDKVTGSSDLTQGSGSVGVQYDQAYLLSVDFSAAKLNWGYYNFKLFHWSNWDTRNEFVMTYVHPLTFTVTSDLIAGYELKFNSPWDIQFSPDVAGQLSGNMTSNIDQGPNFNNITTTGKYKATIVVNNDYKTGTYTFVAQ